MMAFCVVPVISRVIWNSKSIVVIVAFIILLWVYVGPSEGQGWTKWRTRRYICYSRVRLDLWNWLRVKGRSRVPTNADEKFTKVELKIPKISLNAACYIHLTFNTLGYKRDLCLIIFTLSVTQYNVLTQKTIGKNCVAHYLVSIGYAFMPQMNSQSSDIIPICNSVRILPCYRTKSVVHSHAAVIRCIDNCIPTHFCRNSVAFTKLRYGPQVAKRWLSQSESQVMFCYRTS